MYERNQKSGGISCMAIFLAKNALSSTDFSNNDKYCYWREYGKDRLDNIDSH